MSGFFSTVKNLATGGGGGYEEPAYKVVNKTENYEERRYDASKWVTNSAQGMTYGDTGSGSFWKLFGYIGGKNGTSTKIPMTAPVTTLVEPGDGPDAKNNFTMGFYVPQAFQESPPTPNDPDVHIQERSEITIFTRTYGGFANDKVIAEEHKKLLGFLSDADRATVKNDGQKYYIVGYDAPYKLFGRRNEVWLIKNE